MKAYLFPGQGSQAKGMGRNLFGRYPALVAQADRALGYSIEQLCLEDPRQELNRTQFTQPALFVVNALSLQDRLEQSGPPDFVAGHSLGEFNALLAADCFDFETGLLLVRKRAELMGRAPEGAMAAILNLPAEEIARVLAANGLDQVDIANYNTPAQTVISGSKQQVGQAQQHFQGEGVQYLPLNTSGAFHSRLMAAAGEEFASFLAGFAFRPPRIPVVANVDARPYAPDAVAAKLARQITGPVRWTETIAFLQGQAGAVGTAMEFTEVGHGDVLTRLVQKIQAGQQPDAAQADAGPTEPSQRVRQWNAQHGLGTRVRSTQVPGVVLQTRTEAVLLFRHRAAVYMEGFDGYFDLAELAVASPQEPAS